MFTNSYKAPEEPDVLPDSELYGPDPYDVNFPFPIHLQSLQTDRVILTPFIPSIHGQAYWDAVSTNLDLFKFYPFIYEKYEEVLTFFELKFRADPTRIMFAIIDKTRPDPTHPEFGGSLAGVTGLLNTSAQNLSTEIGHVLTFPPFQRTHVTGNAIGVLLKYCLDRTNASPPGLALRRVFWHCHSGNVRSAALAERMGMKREGIMRWHTVLPPKLAANGRKASEHDPFPDRPGRDTFVLSVCWDEWEEGVRERVQGIIDRTV